MITTIIDINAPEDFASQGGMVDFAALPSVGDGLEMDLDMLDGGEMVAQHRAVVSLGGKLTVSLRVRHVYWQPHSKPGSRPHMIPVINTDLIVPERWGD
jgi:hypothetical protein